MSTLVDQARRFANDAENEGLSLVADLLRQLADRVQELEGKGEPVMIYHGRHTIDCGEFGSHDMEMLKLIPAGTKLYTSPPSSVRPEKERRRLHQVRDLIANDAWALSFQTMSQYRSALLRAIDGISPSPSMVGREDTTHE